MTNIQIPDHEIEERARQNAHAAAYEQLKREKAEAAQRAEAERQDQLARASAAERVAREALSGLAPRYARRADLLAALAPALGELVALDAQLNAQSAGMLEPMNAYWRPLGRDPRQELPALRKQAGLPEWHDTVSRGGDDVGARIAQMLGQLIAGGAIVVTKDSMLSGGVMAAILTVGTCSHIIK